MIFKNLTKIVLIFLIISCTTKSTDLSLNQTYKDKFTKFGNRKSAIFVHGLNQKPNKLESIMSVFYDLGYDCYLVHLKGHLTVSGFPQYFGQVFYYFSILFYVAYRNFFRIFNIVFGGNTHNVYSVAPSARRNNHFFVSPFINFRN